MKQIAWRRILFLLAFAASLIANFFAIGYVFRSQSDVPSIGFMAESAFSAYPEPVRTEFRRILRDNRERTGSALRDLREARRELASVATAKPLDKAAVERAMSDVRTATEALQRLMQDYLMQAFEANQEASAR